MERLKTRDAIEKLREMTELELEKKIEDSRHALYDLRVNAKVGKLENTGELRVYKKQIARIMTEKNQRKKVLKV
jgi:ribosomal protein L29